MKKIVSEKKINWKFIFYENLNIAFENMRESLVMIGGCIQMISVKFVGA